MEPNIEQIEQIEQNEQNKKFICICGIDKEETNKNLNKIVSNVIKNVGITKK